MIGVRFYFSFRSPFAGIAFNQVNRVRQAIDADFELLPVWPDIIFGGHMDNPTDNLFKLSYVFRDATRQARDAGLDTAYLEQLAERIPVPKDIDLTKEKAGMKLGKENWEIPHCAFLYAASQGKGWEFGDAMFTRRFGFDGEPVKDVVDPEVIREIADSVGLDGNATASACESHQFDNDISEVIAKANDDGVFGVPFFALDREGGPETFWGNDRIGKVVQTIRDIEGAKEAGKGRVVGIGGLFFKCPDTDKTKQWYQRHLGLAVDEYGTNFEWRQADDGTRKGFSQWSPFKADTKYFEPSTKDYMFNYRVVNIEALIEQLRADGVEIAGEIETFDYGKFAHVMDCDGNKVELWEPNDAVYEGNVVGRTK